MATSKLVKVVEQISDRVTIAYQKIEDAVVGSYTRIEDHFVDRYLAKDGETLQAAKARLKRE